MQRRKQANSPRTQINSAAQIRISRRLIDVDIMQVVALVPGRTRVEWWWHWSLDVWNRCRLFRQPNLATALIGTQWVNPLDTVQVANQMSMTCVARQPVQWPSDREERPANLPMNSSCFLLLLEAASTSTACCAAMRT